MPDTDGPDADGNLDILRRWNATLADAGWAAPAWPREFGGRDATIAEQLAWLEEMAAAGAPGPVNVIGVSNIAPAIMALGTAGQQERFLSPMLRGEEIWSQGMSEPDAGSDLASLRTSARIEGDVFVVNGQKTWNSLGRHADWCQLYVRTDPDAPKHKGLSCLLVDMTTPGIEVRPLKTMAGELTFSELFFTDGRGPGGQPARAPPRRLGGGHDDAQPRAGRCGPAAPVHQCAAGQAAGDAKGQPAIGDPVLRDRLMDVYARVACMRWTTTRELEAIGLRAPAVGRAWGVWPN